MIERLKEINRALLELCLGIIFVGLLCQFIGMWFAESKLFYTIALWLGVMLALITANHMYKTLDRALELGPDATKVVTKANLVRYGCILVVFGIVWAIGTLNLLIMFMGLMSLKVAAYLQPFTHKLCNKIFHEVDPVPQPVSDETDADSKEYEN